MAQCLPCLLSRPPRSTVPLLDEAATGLSFTASRRTTRPPRAVGLPPTGSISRTGRGRGTLLQVSAPVSLYPPFRPCIHMYVCMMHTTCRCRCRCSYVSMYAYAQKYTHVSSCSQALLGMASQTPRVGKHVTAGPTDIRRAIVSRDAL